MISLEGVQITKVFEIHASHRLNNSQLSEEENKELFGKCNNLPSHGHCYVLEVTVSGLIDEKSGMVINFADLKKIVNEKIIEPLDHHFINEVEPYCNSVTTCENMLVYMWKILKPELRRLTKLKLYETSTSYGVYEGEIKI